MRSGCKLLDSDDAHVPRIGNIVDSLPIDNSVILRGSVLCGCHKGRSEFRSYPFQSFALARIWPSSIKLLNLDRFDHSATGSGLMDKGLK